MEKFNTTFRGYNKKQVQKCLDEIIHNYESLLNKSKQTEADNKMLLERLSHYERIEETLNRAIFTAESASDQIKATARKECENMVNEARRNASRIINDALLKAEKAQEQADLLKRNTNILKRRIRQIIETQLEVINELDRVDFKDTDNKY